MTMHLQSPKNMTNHSATAHHHSVKK